MPKDQQVRRRRRERHQIVVLAEGLLPRRIGSGGHPPPVGDAGAGDDHDHKEPQEERGGPAGAQHGHDAKDSQNRPYGHEVIDVADPQEQRHPTRRQ